MAADVLRPTADDMRAPLVRGGYAAFLADASELLAASLDYETTLATVAGLAMPEFGAWCIVDLLEDDGSARRLAVVHPDPAKQALARELARRYPPGMDESLGVPRVVRTRRAELVPEVTDAMLVDAARDERHLAILREFGMSSYMVVPLEARGQILGSITFIGAKSDGLPDGLRYGEADLRLAQDLARRCALAVDSARLYREAERARAEAEAARARAEQSDRVKADFLAKMSHELRTPLNAIAGYTELLLAGLRGPVTGDQADALERVRRNSMHLLTLVNDILTFAGSRDGRLRLDVVDVPLDELLATVHVTVEPQLRRNALTYEYRRCPPGLTVRADRDRLQQIVINLLSNAAKYTPPGGRVVLSCEAAGATAAIRVSDTGCGIPPDKLEAIFEPFVQLSEGLTRTTEGSGLGLAISRDLARLMGGEVSAESVIGAGSTFTLTLPLAMQPANGRRGVAIERRHGDRRRARAAAPMAAPAADSAPARNGVGDVVDEALLESFPASDPPAWVPVRLGMPRADGEPPGAGPG